MTSRSTSTFAFEEFASFADEVRTPTEPGEPELPSEALQTFLSRTTQRVRDNCTVVTRASVAQSYLLHLSTDTQLTSLVPRIAARQSPQEDRTVPRVGVSRTLLSCFLGYATASEDFHRGHAYQRAPWLGGWTVYAVDFEAALVPNAQLVYDAVRTGEHWLVAYSPETAQYTPVVAAKAFYQSVRYVPQSKGAPQTEGTLYVEVLRESLPFSSRHFLTQGHWRIEGPLSEGVQDWSDDAAFRVSAVSREEWLAQKNQCAALLSLSERAPTYLGW